MNTREDLTGLVFNRWTVIEKVNKKGYWLCECECGTRRNVRGRNLKSGVSKSCGCITREVSRQRKKNNKYDLTGIYGIGWTYNTNKAFYFDLEDYEKIKDYSWKENSNGYIQAVRNNKYYLLHRIVCGVSDSKLVVDHKFHEPWDNRKENLRITSSQNNTFNKSIAKNNLSGATGVCWYNDVGKWHSYIWVNGRTVHLGYFDDFNDAVVCRRQAEDQYFGEFSYFNSMRCKDDER